MRAVAVLVLTASVAALASAAQGGPAAPRTGATALLASVSVPGGASGGTSQLTGPPSGTTSDAFAFPADGSVLRVGASTVTVNAQPGTSASAEGSVRALGVSIFAGEVSASSVTARAGAAAGSAGATGDVGTSTITGLLVLGQEVTASANVQVPLADWGTLEVLGSTSSTSDDPRSAESAVTGIRVRLIAEHAGLPAGTEIVVGSVSARARVEEIVAPPPPASDDGSPRSNPRPTLPSPATPTPRRPAPNAPREPGRSIPGAPPEFVRPAPEVAARFTEGGYVFPIFGPAAYGNTFGAYRPDVSGKWHHGEDLVAPVGTPLLAVADGYLFSVGWNDLGGWRLWLRDEAGNEFYYAHLSAYSPLAIAGKRVKAGDVIGFVGDSGASGVPHLHFEIHPAELLVHGYDGVVAPYPFLVGWQRAEDVSFSAGRTYRLADDGLAGPAGAPVASVRAGAVLLDADDISSASGLVPGALKRELARREPRLNTSP